MSEPEASETPGIPPEPRWYSIPENWPAFGSSEQYDTALGIAGVLQQAVRCAREARDERKALRESEEYKNLDSAARATASDQLLTSIERMSRHWQIERVVDWDVWPTMLPEASLATVAIHTKDGEFMAMVFPLVCFTESEIMQAAANKIETLRGRLDE